MNSELRLAHGRVRGWRDGDQASLARHANDREVWINLRDRFPHPYTVAHADAWIGEMLATAPVRNWAIEVDGEAAGGIGITELDDINRHSAEIGFWLGRRHWGRGIVTEAVRALSEYALAELNVLRLFAHAFEWNPASARVLEKAGFVREGVLRRSAIKDGRTIDQFLYARVRE